MNPSDGTTRVLLPKPTSLQMGPPPPNRQGLLTSLTSSATGTRPNPRQHKTATKTEQEWEEQKPNFLCLFVEKNLPLQEVIQVMNEKHHFKASRKQYNTKIAQWRIGKNVKDIEMRAIVCKEMRRKMENPPKSSVFRVRKYPVDVQKIARFKRDKGLEDDDVIMLDAGTPSDISCDTPQPEKRIPSVQGLQTAPEDDTRPFLNITAQALSPFKSYSSVLSPRLDGAFDNPYPYHLSPGQEFAINSPDLSHHWQVPHVRHSSLSPARSPRIHKSPFNSPRHRCHSPLSRTASTSPPTIWADFMHSPLGSTLSHKDLEIPFDTFAKSLSNTMEPDLFRFDWFESFINYGNSSRSPSVVITSDSRLGNLFRSFVRKLDTHEARKEQEVLGRSWSVLKQNLVSRPLKNPHYCVTCCALTALLSFETYIHYLTCHPKSLPRNMDLNFVVSETLQAFLPALESGVEDVMNIAVSAAWVLTQEGRYEVVSRVIEAILQEMDFHPDWNGLRKSVGILSLADIYVSCGRHDRARKIVYSILGAESAAVATIAADTIVEFTTADILSGGYSISTAIWDLTDLSFFELTEEGLETIKEYMGEERMNSDVVYVCSILVLRRLNKYQVVDVTEEEESHFIG
ncbi:hypothetical protein MMC18_004235 [Xylographa bjoerkii]|nr:hypothetical protein [Xylographa bjoerkii]